MEKYIFNKYKNHIIILDNARSHNNDYVKKAIINSGNKYLFTIPYTPKTNAIENWFSQLKHYLKLNKKILRYDQLKQQIKLAIKNITKENYQNYFNNSYNRNYYDNYMIKKSSLLRKPKNYK